MTEASVNLAEDTELLQLMVEAGFYAVFLAKTPDTDSLHVTRKLQNTRNPLLEACRQINSAGLRIAGIYPRLRWRTLWRRRADSSFVEESSIPQPMLGILQACPSRLWNRLTAEQRLLKGVGITEVGDQNTLMNFTPTRPVAEIARGMFGRCTNQLTTSGAAFNNA